jgi:hypothetical protein
MLRVTALILFLMASMGAAGMFAFVRCPCMPRPIELPAPNPPTEQLKQAEPLPPPATIGAPQVPNP